MSGYKFFDPDYDDFLIHYGVKGQVHGIRNYQFRDGTWTELGKERRRIGNIRGEGRSVSEPKHKKYSKKAEEEFLSAIKPDVDAVNTGHHPLAYGNCGYCSIAYEMRRRGYDVKATLGDGMMRSDLQKVFKKKFEPFDADPYGVGYCIKTSKDIVKRGGKSSKETPPKILNEIYSHKFSKKEIHEIEDELIRQGDGARGIIYNVWSGTNLSSAHYLNYEIKNGSVYQIDTQSRMVYRGLSKEYLDYSCFAVAMRTDNAKINEKAFEELFHNSPKKKADLSMMHSGIKGGHMGVQKMVSLFRETFPDLVIGELRHVDEWYIFTVANAPKDKSGDIEAALDPYIGYNTQTNRWDSVNPRTIGVGKFFNAKTIPFE